MEQVGQGMIPAGKYVHRNTGKSIYVRDSVQDGESLLVITDQGQLTMKEFSEYLQVEDGEDIYIPTVNDLYGEKKPNKQLLAQINQGLDPEDRIKTKDTTQQENQVEVQIEQKQPKNKN